jgi:hypothetical protein
VNREASIRSKVVREGIPARQAGMIREKQHESEHCFEKTKPICGRPNECKRFTEKGLWRFCRFGTVEKQTQSKPMAGLWPEIPNTKLEILNMTNGYHLTEHDLKKQSQFAGCQMSATVCGARSYENNFALRLRENKPSQSQFQKHPFGAEGEDVQCKAVC